MSVTFLSQPKSAWEMSHRRAAEVRINRRLVDAEILGEDHLLRPWNFVEISSDAPRVRLACAAAHRL
jgi:hypothetical protein